MSRYTKQVQIVEEFELDDFSEEKKYVTHTSRQ